MVKKYLLIKDSEKEFAARLIDRLNELYGEIDILIVYEDEISGMNEDELFVFSDERTGDPGKIYRFQKAADIRREIKEKSGGCENTGGVDDTDLTIVLSPSGNAYQRNYIYEEAKKRSESRSILTINIGFFSDNRINAEGIGLSELCFEIFKGFGSTIDKQYIDKAIYCRDGIDVMRPFSSPVHLIELRGELAELINIIVKTCKYDELFIGVETLFPGIDEVIAKSKEVIILRASGEEETDVESGAYSGLREYVERVCTDNSRIKERKIGCLITGN
ncbi:MAG: hypothetical protein K6E46_01385 [Lachnospiraceae bacterium]|nr:hypothetical protein [Lachnospiraceae bacterium]